MNYRKISFILVISLMFNTSCNKQNSPDKWSEEEISNWFESKEWLGNTVLRPHESIDRKQFAAHYHLNKPLWDKAFDYLINTDLKNIEIGIHEIQGRELYVMVTEYSTKDPTEIFFENHQEYTDIQYVVYGREFIGLTEPRHSSIRTPYQKDRDITFYNVTNSKNLLADPRSFFIFFEENIHCPAIRVNGSEPVKKVVIKIKNRN
ncbi:YhcH/YjgK/YiaL family protein [Cecembia rubra]|uniref:YhcH/YjgK/YiaL family protein n=1 Tax=Cecembia rubra TaxID=1485585 RepID=A0A2P8E4C5_9BACT|nr:YhcH/YjgK/YiaL family protein [Cecembia rubra]PSL04315.1 YhcH/YjgK/YiaL family protein [Cecembia rubra]